MLRLLLGVCVLIVWSGAGLSDQPSEIKIGYLRQAPSRLKMSLIDIPAGNDGLAGAQLATEDDNTTGHFLNQHYTLVETLLGEGDDPVAAMNALADQGASFIVTSLDADRLLKVADAGKARGETLINASAVDGAAAPLEALSTSITCPGSCLSRPLSAAQSRSGWLTPSRLQRSN